MVQAIIKLVNTLTMIKQNEIALYERKVLELKEIIILDSSNLFKIYKYNLAKGRLEKLKITIKELQALETKILKNNFTYLNTKYDKHSNSINHF